MTCIAGVAQNGKVWIGADSAGVNASGDLQLRRDSKVFRNGEYLIGVSGSWRAMQILRFGLLPKAPVLDYKQDPSNPFEFMVEDFLRAMRNMDLPADNLEILVGFRGRLFHIYGVDQVAEEIADYEACGSGAQVARGCIFGSLGLTMPPPDRIKFALQAAERFCSGVRGPFTILEL